VELKADLTALPQNERRALARIVEAAQAMDGLYLRQVWPGNGALLVRLSQDASPAGRLKLHAFLLNKGPWDRVVGEEAFLPGVPPHRPPEGVSPARKDGGNALRQASRRRKQRRRNRSRSYSDRRRASP